MSSPTTPNKKPKELSSEVRMVLAFILMGLILVATPFVYRKLGLVQEQPASQKKAASSTSSAGSQDSSGQMAPLNGQQPAVATPAPSTSGSSGLVSAVGGTKAETQTIETKLYRVVFSNEGAVVKSWTLKDYKDRAGKPLELVNEPGAKKLGVYPFSLEFRGAKPSRDLNKILWAAQPGADGLTVTYRYSDGRTNALKSFTFQQDGGIVQVADDISLDGRPLPNLLQWRGGFGDMAVQNAAGQQATIHYDSTNRKLVRTAAKSAKDGPQTADGSFSFAGLDDQYFTAAFLPPGNGTLQTTTFDDIVPTVENKAEEPFPGVAVGGEAANKLALYVGPKRVSSLHQVNPKLEDIVDWGWFGIIAKPLFIVLHWMNDQFVHNYGWSIILLTIAINIALFPLKFANLKSMRKMQTLQPEITRINDKYKGISMSDPRSQQKQQEIMELHKKHGVNPLGGCIPLLIQLPFLYGFYKVLTVSVEMRSATWLWVPDLSQPEHLAIRILPLLQVASGYLLQKMTPATGGDPQQQKMMQFTPLMFGFFFWSASSGLVLYWLTGNLVAIAQQWFFNKTVAPAVITTKDGRKRA